METYITRILRKINIRDLNSSEEEYKFYHTIFIEQGIKCFFFFLLNIIIFLKLLKEIVNENLKTPYIVY